MPKTWLPRREILSDPIFDHWLADTVHAKSAWLRHDQRDDSTRYVFLITPIYSQRAASHSLPGMLIFKIALDSLLRGIHTQLAFRQQTGEFVGVVNAEGFCLYHTHLPVMEGQQAYSRIDTTPLAPEESLLALLRNQPSGHGEISHLPHAVSAEIFKQVIGWQECVWMARRGF